MNKKRIQARIAELIKEREAYIAQANLEVNHKVGEYDGAIAELRRLLDDGDGDLLRQQ